MPSTLIKMSSPLTRVLDEGAYQLQLCLCDVEAGGAPGRPSGNVLLWFDERVMSERWPSPGRWSSSGKVLLFAAYMDPPADRSADRFKVNVVWEE
jgi:hypothetical protein